MKIEAVPFARKVLEFAEQEHEDYQFDMSVFWQPISMTPLKCGTSACLAGTAVFLDSEVTIKNSWPWRSGNWMTTVDMVERASELLGLSEIEAGDLFYSYHNAGAKRQLRRLIEEAEDRESTTS